MKKFYLSTVFFFAIFTGQAQIVNIPDPNFKSFLINYQPAIDTNSDGEIQVSEALAVTTLTHDNFDQVTTDLTGINAFSNLTSLTLFGLITVVSIDLSGLTNLQNLDCSSNWALTTLNLSGLVNLRDFTCSDNLQIQSLDLSQSTQLQTANCNLLGSLTSLNVSNLSQLTTLNCTQGSLTTLNASGLSALQKLNCSSNDITNLNLTGATSLVNLYCNLNSISSISIPNPLQLQKLDISSNPLQTFDLSGFINLTELICGQIGATFLNVSNLVNLTKLDCSNNSLTSIDVSNLVNLRTFGCGFNQLSSLDVSTLINLEDFTCGQNNLTSLNVSPLIHLVQFNCFFNQLTTIDLTQQTALRKVDCSYNLFSSLDFSQMDTSDQNPFSHQIGFYNNPNLVYLNIKNGLNINTIFIGSPDFSENTPSLTYLCADEENIVPIISRLQSDGNNNVQVNSYCTFSPGGAYNTIAGTQTYDIDNNGCSGTDPIIPLLNLFISDGTESGATFTNATGNYSFFTQAGSFVLTPVFENPYFTISPSSATITFGSVDSSTQTQNFCITPNGIHNDIEISILPIQRARPGFDATYQLVYKNKGNQVLSGNVNFTFDDAVLDFVTANPATTNQTANALNWSYTNLLPFESRTIDFTLNVNSPMEVPSVELGTILNFTASIDPVSGDETPADNIFSLSQTVVGSFDPNDKTCLEGNTITPEMVGKYLHYLIRFQNSGTAAAENVVIKDIIDTTKFDMASLQLTSSSHPQVTKITGNKVEFQFQGINLPAEIDDAPGSNGYVAFKIKTKNNLVIGDSVSNKADIFFDYNFPIETNTATSTVALLGINAFENTSVTVTPNPAKDIVHITSRGNITSVQLFDLLGRILETMTDNDDAVDFDLSQKSRGVYFVKVYTVKGIKVEKVIKD